MKNLESILKLGSVLGVGSSILLAIVITDYYISLAKEDRAFFIVLLIGLSIVNAVSQFLTTLYNRRLAKPKERIVYVYKQEESPDAMTNIWESSYE